MLHRLLILLFCSCLCTITYGQIQPAAFAQNIVAALKAKSFEKFKALFVDTADLKEVLAEKKWPQDTSSYRANYEKLMQTAESDCKRIFNNIIEKGEQVGVVWIVIEYRRMEADIIKPGYSNHRVLKGVLTFTCRDIDYQLTGIEAVQVARGFRITKIASVAKITH